MENSKETDPTVLRGLRRKYNPFSPRPIKEPKQFYGGRLGHVSGVNTSWKVAQPHTIGIRSDYKRFKTRQKAETYVAPQVTQVKRRSPLQMRSCTRTTLPCWRRGPSGGEFTLLAPQRPLSRSGVPWIGALRPINNLSTMPRRGFVPLIGPPPRPIAGV